MNDPDIKGERAGRRRPVLLTLTAVFFLLWGGVWFVTIYQRCKTIVPERRLIPTLREILPVFHGPRSGESPRTVRRFRSPYVKWYYFFLFWTLAVLELVVALSYMLAGLALLRRYRRGFRWVLTALGGDLFYKSSVTVYLLGCARPLAELIHKPVGLVSYTMPDKSIFSTLSSIFSGVGFLPPNGRIMNGVVYLVVLGACFYLFSRDRIKSQFPR